MPDRIEACFFVEGPPEFEYRDGMFHITHRIGNYSFERCMQPSVFMQALRAAAECARKHKFGTGEVIHAEFASKFERIFPKKDKGA